MAKSLSLLILTLGFLDTASTGYAQAVEYMRVCSLYGSGFYYIPGSDICTNSFNGDSRQQSEFGTMRSFLPYPEGEWVTDPKQECDQGQLVKLGSFKSSDFTLLPALRSRKATPPFSLPLSTSQFISKVMMSGGFYDPRIPARTGFDGAGSGIPVDGMCLRSIDPDVLEQLSPNNLLNPLDGDGDLPIGCISNTRLANMPRVYSITSTAAYPQIDIFFNDAAQDVAGPYVYGDQLVITTDLGQFGPGLLTYCDPSAGSCTPGTLIDGQAMTYSPNGPGLKPLAGTLNVWACVEGGSDSQNAHNPEGGQ